MTDDLRRRLQLSGLALVLALIIGACGSDEKKSASPAATNAASTAASTSSSSGRAASVDACKLSGSDISSIVGFTVVKQDGSSASECTYAAPGGGDAVGSTVQFGVTPFSGSAAEAKIAADAVGSPFGVGTEAVSGVGDEAFFLDATIFRALVVFSGQTKVIVSIGSLEGDVADRKDQVIALAKKLLS